VSFNSNSYAQIVNKRSVKEKRTQSLTKFNPLGMGVLYNWDWAWSYSEYSTDDELKKPNEANYGPKGKNGRYSGQFVYIGLSVQLPTLERIRGGHLKSVNKEQDRKFYRALGTALYNEKTGDNRIISNPLEIPKIFHICSLFDLGALEEHMIKTYDTFKSRNTYNDFGSLVQDLGGGANGNVIGVNTDKGGGGGPLYNTKRTIQEWIMAGYYYVNETDPDVLASRSSTSKGINIKPKGSLSQKIRELFIEADRIISSNVTSFLLRESGINVNDKNSLGAIPDFLKSLGLRDDVGIIKNAKNEIDETKNFLDTMEGRKGRDFLLALSIDTDIAKFKIFQSDSGFVSSKRDAFIERILDIKNLGNLKKIDANLNAAFEDLTNSVRAAGAQTLLVEVQRRKNDIIKALENDAYKDLAEAVAFVKTKDELLNLLNDGKDIPDFLKPEIQEQIKKAKISIINSFNAVEKILNECIVAASSKTKAKNKRKQLNTNPSKSNMKDS
jgi:hypothetical protein